MTSGTTTVRDATFGTELLGAGPADLVWSHGLTSSRAAERRFPLVDLDGLDGTARVLRYDARGHGETEAASFPHGSTNAWADAALDQLALAEANGIDTYVAGGASLGTGTSLWAAVHAPDRIRGLVLVIPPTAWDTRRAQRDRYELMASIVDAKGTRPLIDGLDDAPVPDAFRGDPAWRARAERNLLDADPQRLAFVLRSMTGADLPEPDVLAGIEAPALVLAWSGDDGHPVATADRLDELLPDVTTHVAHSADDVATWTDRVRTFLESLA